MVTYTEYDLSNIIIDIKDKGNEEIMEKLLLMNSPSYSQV